MHLAGKSKRRLVDEINITPLTDVFLVLLIIMMVVAPMMKMTRMEIHTPEVDSGGELDASKLVVEVTKEGVYFVGGSETVEAELSNAFKAKAKEPPEERGLIIQGDREALSKYAIAIFKAAKEAEYKKVTLAVATKNAPAATDKKEPDQPITPQIKPLEPPSP
jgi:biopolymer transport protein ExbD